MADQLTETEVCNHMGVELATLSAYDEAHLKAVVAAVLDQVRTVVPSVRKNPEAPWSPSVKQGAVQLAARLFARRNSPTGVAGLTDMGGAAFIARYDSDLERLFGIGSWSPPLAV